MDDNERNGQVKPLLQSMLKILLEDIKVAKTQQSLDRLAELARNLFPGDPNIQSQIQDAISAKTREITSAQKKAETEAEKSDVEKSLEEMEERCEKKSVQLTVSVYDQVTDKKKEGRSLQASDLSADEQAALIVELSSAANQEKVEKDLAKIKELKDELKSKQLRNPSEAIDKQLARLQKCHEVNTKLKVMHKAAEQHREQLNSKDIAQRLQGLNEALVEVQKEPLALEQLQAAPSHTKITDVVKQDEYAEKNKTGQGEKSASSTVKKSPSIDDLGIELEHQSPSLSASELGNLTPLPTPAKQTEKDKAEQVEKPTSSPVKKSPSIDDLGIELEHQSPSLSPSKLGNLSPPPTPRAPKGPSGPKR